MNFSKCWMRAGTLLPRSSAHLSSCACRKLMCMAMSVWLFASSGCGSSTSQAETFVLTGETIAVTGIGAQPRIRLHVTGDSDYAAASPDTVIAVVTPATILRPTTATLSSINPGSRVRVTFNGVFLRSSPVQVVALRIEHLD